MTSKSSFWKLSLYNVKKRIWTYALAIGILFCAMPVATFMNLSTTLHRYTKAELASDAGRWVINSFIEVNVAGFALYGILTSVIAVVFALQGFSYLQSQKKVDMYKSVPVKENTRYAYIAVNSIVGYMVIFIINMLMVDACFILNGVMSAAVWKASCFSILYNLLVFASVYFLTSIAELICGSTILAFFGSLVLLTVEPIISALIDSSKSIFFSTYVNFYDGGEWLTDGVLTPFEIIFAIIYKAGTTDDFYIKSDSYGILIKYLLILLVQAIVFAACSFIAYKKRPAQIGGKSIIFKPLKWIIKVVILFIGICFAALAFVSVSGTSDSMYIAYGFIGIVISFVILHCVLQTILEKDFKECLTGFPSSILALVCAVLAYCVFAFDLVGYDSYIPSSDQVAYYTMIRDVEYQHDYYDDDFNYRSNTDFLTENARIDDDQIISVSIEAIEAAIDAGKYRYNDYDENVNEGQEGVLVYYEMTNGKKVYRQYTLKPETVRTMFVAAYSDHNYRTMLEEVNSPQISNGLQDKAYTAELAYHCYIADYADDAIKDKEQILAIYEALRDDVNSRDANVILDEFTIGQVDISISKKPVDELSYYYDTSISFYIPIYESDENTIALLKEYGIYQDDAQPADNISSIEYEIYDSAEGSYTSQTYTPEDEEFADLYERFVSEYSIRRVVGSGLVADQNNYVWMYAKDGYTVSGFLKYADLAE